MDLKLNETCQGFKLTRIDPIPNLQAQLYTFVDEATGMQLFFMHNSDANCGFNICFETPVFNDKGTPHILEHSVLAGSRKYPVKDPFFTTLKSSPNTFMNASTYQDRTQYLASSQVAKDFENLFDIYLDAAYFPLLRAETFYREGHRLEIQDGKLNHVGVVYNEMKTYMNNSDILGYFGAMHAVFGEQTYGYESGGVPEAITDLTIDELRDYHQTYYTPGNSCISFYGNLDIEKYLAKIRKDLLQASSHKPAHRSVGVGGPQARPVKLTDQEITTPDEPVIKSFQLPASESAETAGILIYAFVGEKVNSMAEMLDCVALNTLLFDNDFSPMKHALDSAKFGKNAWVYSSVESHLYSHAMIGLKGAGEKEQAKFLELITDTCEQIIAKGVEKPVRDYILRKINIGERGFMHPHEITSELNELWLYDEHPSQRFDLETELASLAKRIETPDYFTKLLKQLILDNPKRNYCVVKPSAKQFETENKKLAQKLAQLQQNMTDQELQELTELNERLRKTSSEAEDPKKLALLPKIAPKDITSKLEDVPEQIETGFYLHPQPTRGLTYVDVLTDISHLPPEQLIYAVLMSELLGRIGANDLSAEQMQERINQEIATNINCDIHARASSDGKLVKAFLTLSGHALYADSEKLAAILNDYLTKPNLDEQTIINTIMQELQQDLMQEIIMNGHDIAKRSGAAMLSNFGRIVDELEGAAMIKHFEEVYALWQKSPDGVIKKLQELASEVKTAARFVSITCEEQQLAAQRELMKSLLQQKIKPQTLNFKLKTAARQNTAFKIPSQVASVAMHFAGPVYQDPDLPALQVLCKVLSGDYLHQAVRERGGAYGGYAGIDQQAEAISFFSYRDPNIKNTIAAFSEAVDWLATGEFTQQQVDDAICVMIGRIDAPHSPHTKGLNQTLMSLLGVSYALREAQRARLLTTTREQLIAAGKKYLKDPLITIVAADTLYKKESKDLKKYNLQFSVLK